MAYLYLIAAKFKRLLQHRTDALLWLFGASLHLVVDLAVIFTVYSFVPQIEGFQAYECVLIYAMYGIVESTFYTFFAWTMWFSGRYVVGGQLTMILTKPARPLLLLIATNASREELLYLGTQFVLFIVAAAKLRLGILKGAALFGCVVPGVLTVAGLFLIVACIGARFPQTDQAFSPLMRMMEFACYPTAIYPRIIRFVLKWVIPYSLIGFVPVSLILGIDISDMQFRMWWLPLYGCGIFALGYGLFRGTTRSYEASGT